MLQLACWEQMAPRAYNKSYPNRDVRFGWVGLGLFFCGWRSGDGCSSTTPSVFLFAPHAGSAGKFILLGVVMCVCRVRCEERKDWATSRASRI
jgi:hypothetical protein